MSAKAQAAGFKCPPNGTLPCLKAMLSTGISKAPHTSVYNVECYISGGKEHLPSAASIKPQTTFAETTTIGRRTSMDTWHPSLSQR